MLAVAQILRDIGETLVSELDGDAGHEDGHGRGAQADRRGDGGIPRERPRRRRGRVRRRGDVGAGARRASSVSRSPAMHRCSVARS